jgi:hypothetical protein
MRKTPFLVTGCALLALAGCARPSDVTSREMLLSNPLYAISAHDETITAITDLQITTDKTQSGSLVDTMEKAKEREFSLSRAAKQQRDAGLFGAIIPVTGSAAGDVLVGTDRLWTGPDFYITPGMDVHVYLSGLVDPRDTPFPSLSDIDLGTLPSTFGPLTIAVPPTTIDVRSVVFWDATLNKLLGFAQVSRVAQ